MIDFVLSNLNYSDASPAYSKLERKISTNIVVWIIRSAIEDGSIDAENKSDLELVESASTYILDNFKIDTKMSIVLDHTPDLLSIARKSVAENNIDHACLMYATWSEHFINKLVITYSTRKNITKADIKNMVRDVPLRSKMTWLLTVLEGKPIHPNHVKAIIRMSEFRNYYVHYKWTPSAAEDPIKDYNIRKNHVLVFEKTIEYLMSYRRRYILKISRHRLSNLAGQIVDSVRSRNATS